MANRVNPKSQTDKRIDAGLGGGVYTAGAGLWLSENRFSLKEASTLDRGGVMINMGDYVSEDDNTNNRDHGTYKDNNGFVKLRTALRTQKGGFYLGDGFVPELKEKINAEGEKTYTFDDTVKLRLGEGLYFPENTVNPSDIEEEKENFYGGRKVAVKRATADEFGAVKPGQWLSIGADGRLNVILRRGLGTLIAESGEIVVNVDDKSIRFNDEGQLETDAVVIENAIVIKEADAKHILHEYTELEYIAGNRVVYAGPYNQIIVQGYIFYAWGGTAPNGVKIPEGAQASQNLSEIPDMPLYQKITFSPSAYIGTIGWTKSLEWIFDGMTNDYTTFYSRYTREDGTVSEGSPFNNYGDYSEYGFSYLWKSIISPGTVYQGKTFEYGGVICRLAWRYKETETRWIIYVNYTTNLDVYVPFTSEAEYNAAIGLTYEPITLTEVQETTTEV